MDEISTDDDVLDDPAASFGARSMHGRTALVAGGGLSGVHGSVGYAISWLFAREGARVAVFDRDPDAAKATVERIVDDGGDAFAITGDATVEADCSAAVQAVCNRWGHLDALADTVADGGRDSILDVSVERFDQVLDINLKSAWLLIKHASAVMSEGSSIVTVSSMAAVSPGPGMPYSIAKAGLENLTIGAAAALGPQGIRVNGVRVGMIWSSFAARGMSEQMRAARSQAVSLQREGNVWDIAHAVLFLAGERARWVSGHILQVDGGGPYRGGGSISAAPEVKK